MKSMMYILLVILFFFSSCDQQSTNPDSACYLLNRQAFTITSIIKIMGLVYVASGIDSLSVGRITFNPLFVKITLIVEGIKPG